MNSSKKIKDQQEKEAVSTVSVPEKKVKKAKKISRFAGVDKKPVILVTLCIVVVLVLCIGVGIQQFKPKVIMTVNKTKITMDDMMYPIYEVESQYLPYDWRTTYKLFFDCCVNNKFNCLLYSHI